MLLLSMQTSFWVELSARSRSTCPHCRSSAASVWPLHRWSPPSTSTSSPSQCYCFDSGSFASFSVPISANPEANSAEICVPTGDYPTVWTNSLRPEWERILETESSGQSQGRVCLERCIFSWQQVKASVKSLRVHWKRQSWEETWT